MTEREAAYLVAEKGEHSPLVKELKRTTAESTDGKEDEQDSTNGTVTVTNEVSSSSLLHTSHPHSELTAGPAMP